MHSPTKLIYEGDSERAALFMGEAHTLLNKARGIADAAGVGMFGKSATLAEGVVAYALYTTQQSVIVINAAPQFVPSTKAVQVTRSRPKFYSGVVKDCRLITSGKPDAGEWDLGPPPDISSYSVLSTYKPTPVWRTQYNAFVDKQNAANKDTPGYTPYTPLGAGYQRLSQLAVDAPKWYDVFPQPTETVIPSQYYKITPSCYSGHMKKLAQYVLGLGRLDADELAPEDDRTDEVQQSGFVMRYDFRFHSTHGLVKGPDNRWWLVEISQMNGVLAMPLPLYEDYDKEGEEVPAPELEEMAVVNKEFGGQPTGECFPVGAALDEAITRGDVLRLLSAETIAEFYNYSPYSTCWGWAFSSDGHEAHNTAHTIEPFTSGAPIGVGVHYRVAFRFGAVNKEREEGQPVGSGSATLARVSRGYLARPGPNGPQFHYPEPLLSGGALRTYMFPTRTFYTYCDTTMGVFFIGKSLQIIRFYYNQQSMSGYREGVMPEGCEVFTGTYQWTDYSPGGHLPPQFYTTEFDKRETLAPLATNVLWAASLGGYSGIKVQDLADGTPRRAWCTRFRTGTLRRTSVAQHGRAYGTQIVCPYGAREAYVFMHWDFAESTVTSKSVQPTEVQDPWLMETFRWYFRLPDPHRDCYDLLTRKVESMVKVSPQCGHLADSGPWSSVCSPISSSYTPPGWGSGTTTTATKTEHIECFLISNSEKPQVKLNIDYDDVGLWLLTSPTIDGSPKRFDCVFSALGAFHMTHSKRLTTGGSDYATYGYLHTEGDSGFFSYLGVL